MTSMKLATPALIALFLAATPALAADKPRIVSDLRHAGFVLGVQERMCIGDHYVAEIVAGAFKPRLATDAEREQSRSTIRRYSGKSVRYEARNEGEFGGQLDAILDSGERRLMLKRNTQSFVPFDKDL